MKKNGLIIVILMFCLVLKEARADKFKVGLVLPLTGQAADYGFAIRNSIELAIKDNPDLFSNIEFLYEDAAYDPKQAVSAFQKLKDVNKVQLAYTWGVSFCKAIAPLAEINKLPTVGQCIDHTSSAGKNYFLRFMNYNDEYMKKLADYLAKNNWKKLAIIVAEHPYQEDLFASLKRNLHGDQSIFSIENIPLPEMDLKTIALKLKKDNFDAIGVFLFIGQTAQFYKQAKQININLPTFGTNLFESISEVKSAAGNMDGAIFVNNKVNLSYLVRYKKLYGNSSQLAFGAPAYEFALILGKLFNSENSNLTPEKIIEKFSLIKEETGTAAGPYYFKDTPETGKYFQFPLAVKKIKGLEFEIVE